MTADEQPESEGDSPEKEATSPASLEFNIEFNDRTGTDADGAASGEELSIAELEKIVAADPANTDASSRLAYKYFTEERYYESAAAYELLIKQRPNDLFAFFALAKSYAYAGRFDKSLKTARSALNQFYQGMYIAVLYDRAIETLELIDLEDSNPARKRLACLFAAYASSFAERYISSKRATRPDMPNEPGLYWYEKALLYPEPGGERDPLELKIHYRAGMEYWYGVGRKEWWRPTLSEEDYWRLPQYEEARKAFERSVAPYSFKEWGELLVEKIYPFEMLSASYVRTGRAAEAVEPLRQSLALIYEIDESVYGAPPAKCLEIIVRDLDHHARVSLSEVYESLGEHTAAVECLLEPISTLIEYKKYTEAAGLIRQAEEIAAKHPVEQSPKIAELRHRLESEPGQAPERRGWLRRFFGGTTRRH